MTRIEEEKLVVEKMIRLYCRKKEGNPTLCDNCINLLEYASSRLDKCRHGNSKPTCKKCAIHCYRPEMKSQIRQIMRWAGPWMILYHPVSAIKHLIREL